MRKKTMTVIPERREKQKNDIWLSTATDFFFCLLCLFGSIGLFSALPAVGEMKWVLMGSGWITCGIFFLSRKNEATGLLAPIFLFLAALSLFFLRTSSVAKGLLMVINQILDQWNQTLSTYHSAFAVTGVTQGDLRITAVILGIFQGLLLCYVVWYRWMAVCSILVFVLAGLSCFLHLYENMFAGILLVAGWIGIWAGEVLEKDTGWGKRLFLGFCVLIVGGLGVISLKSYQKSDKIAAIKTELQETMHRLRYGEDSLPKGNLKKAGQLLEKGEDENTLQLSFDHMEEMYLRGYVGAVYDGDSWSQLPNEAYQGKQTGMLEWLESQQFSSMFEYASCWNLEKQYGNSEQQQLSDLESEAFSVINNGADREYIYVPNTVQNISDARYRPNQDWQLKAAGFSGAAKYQFQALTGVQPTEIMTEPQWLTEENQKNIQTYRESEAVYRTFVKEHYLDISKEQKEQIEQLFFSGDSWKKEWDNEEKTKSIYSATSRIRLILDILADYTEHPDELPEDTDFVTWFLKEGKQGNCVHFATAAVLAYRTLGIPARYAEGYYVSKEQAAQLEEEGKNQVQLTEKNGHAWAEIYIDGIGWCPVEITPGFYHELYSPEEIIDVPEDETDQIIKKQKVDVDESFYVDKNKEEEKEQVNISWNIIGIVLLVLLVSVGIFFLLEMQRFLRRMWIFYTVGKKDSLEKVHHINKKICILFCLSGMQEDLRYPFEVTDSVIKHFPTVKKEEYERVVKVEQQAVFGQKELKPNEWRVLNEFYDKLLRSLYDRASVWKKLYFRYVKCI